jgi:hypothetical protein
MITWLGKWLSRNFFNETRGKWSGKAQFGRLKNASL